MIPNRVWVPWGCLGGHWLPFGWLLGGVEPFGRDGASCVGVAGEGAGVGDAPPLVPPQGRAPLLSRLGGGLSPALGGWTDGQPARWISGWLDGWVDGQTGGWPDRQMDW